MLKSLLPASSAPKPKDIPLTPIQPLHISMTLPSASLDSFPLYVDPRDFRTTLNRI